MITTIKNSLRLDSLTVLPGLSRVLQKFADMISSEVHRIFLGFGVTLLNFL